MEKKAVLGIVDLCVVPLPFYLVVFTCRADYLPGAFLVSEELTELAGTVKCLDNIDFKLVYHLKLLSLG